MGKSYDEALVRGIVTNPRIMRQMPRLLRETGFHLVGAFPHVLSDCMIAGYRWGTPTLEGRSS